jgi:hypothetical protein
MQKSRFLKTVKFWLVTLNKERFMSMFSARQGDIFFRADAKGPVLKNTKRHDNPVIAQGEITGHAHKTTTPPMSELDSVVDEAGDIWVRNQKGPITIGHEEHSAVELPANQWIRITRQREYDPGSEAKQRRVAD